MVKLIDTKGRERALFPNAKSAARYAFDRHSVKLRPCDIYDGATVYFKRRRVQTERRTTRVDLIRCTVTIEQ